jgi:hypothetical protein
VNQHEKLEGIIAMRITPEIVAALREASRKQGSNVDLSKACGIHNSTLGKYANGIIKTMEDDTWDLLAPHLRPYLDAPDPPPGSVVEAPAPWRHCGVYGLTLCASEGFRFGDVVPDNDDVEQVPVPTEINGVKRPSAFRAVDHSMAPLVNDGDLVFIDPDSAPAVGKVALVKYDDTVVCKTWVPDPARKVVTLESVSPDVQDLEVAEGDIRWAYPAGINAHRPALVLTISPDRHRTRLVVA